MHPNPHPSGAKPVGYLNPNCHPYVQAPRTKWWKLKEEAAKMFKESP
jgi:hypothetical protein